MFRPGMKVSPDTSWKGGNYPELIKAEYTVKYSFITSSFTWVVLEEFPEYAFNTEAFYDRSDEGPYFAVKTENGGLIISDLEALRHMGLLDSVLDYKELNTLNQVRDYFAGCAVCGDSIVKGENPGLLQAGELVILPVCSRCCQQNPQIKAVIPKPRTYHDIEIDWWDELRKYGETIQDASLADSIQKEIDATCDHCEKADNHPDCEPGACPHYLLQDYLALNHKHLYETIKQLAEERLREAFPDPNEQ